MNIWSICLNIFFYIWKFIKQERIRLYDIGEEPINAVENSINNSIREIENSSIHIWNQCLKTLQIFPSKSVGPINASMLGNITLCYKGWKSTAIAKATHQWNYQYTVSKQTENEQSHCVSILTFWSERVACASGAT